MKHTIDTALETLVSNCGFRVSTIDMRRLGIPEHFVFDACTAGRARLERTYLIPLGLSVYLIFA